MRTKIVFGIWLLGLMVLSCAPRAEVPVAAQLPVAVAQTTTVAELPAVVASPTVAPIATAALIAPAAPATESGAVASVTAPPAATSGSIHFKLLPGDTVASFALTEVLYGALKTVTGTTSEVQGGLTVDFSNPGKAGLDPIEIAAGSFVTDSGRRDGAIRRFILDAGNYPLIRFVPESIGGLPDKVKAGDQLMLTVSGDLTIVDVTRSEAFSVSVLVVSEQLLQGEATVTVLRSNYGLRIPSLPFLADVADEVVLTIRFVAAPE